MKNTTEKYGNKTDLISVDWNNNRYQERIVIAIDWEDEEVYCMSRSRNDGCPMDVYHGLRWFIDLPENVDATKLHDWIDLEIMPIVSEYAEHYNTQWDGHNWIADWKEYADEQIIDKISQICEYAPTNNRGGLWDAVDWLAYYTYSDFDISIDTTDVEIKEIADEIRDNAEIDGVVLLDLEEYLIDLKDEIEEDEE